MTPCRETLFFVVPEATHKASQGSETETRELLGRMEKKSISPHEGSLICPPGKSMIFYLSGPPNI